MIPRNELMSLLHDRLQNLNPQQIEKLADDILALGEGWDEMAVTHQDMGYSHSDLCSSICWIASEAEHGSEIKLYRKKKK